MRHLPNCAAGESEKRERHSYSTHKKNTKDPRVDPSIFLHKRRKKEISLHGGEKSFFPQNFLCDFSTHGAWRFLFWSVRGAAKEKKSQHPPPADDPRDSLVTPSSLYPDPIFLRSPVPLPSATWHTKGRSEKMETRDKWKGENSFFPPNHHQFLSFLPREYVGDALQKKPKLQCTGKTTEKHPGRRHPKCQMDISNKIQ